jgi:hypothetical protein
MKEKIGGDPNPKRTSKKTKMQKIKIQIIFYLNYKQHRYHTK